MRGVNPPLPQYAFMTWCSVKESTGATLPYLPELARHCSCSGLATPVWVQ